MPILYNCPKCGKGYQNIYRMRNEYGYVSWHCLTHDDQNWHERLKEELAKLIEEDRTKKIPSTELYVFDDIRMDTPISTPRKPQIPKSEV